jgi:hypothetical protein
MKEIPNENHTHRGSDRAGMALYLCHVLRGHDLDVDTDRVRLDCSHCFRRLLEIETIVGEKTAA